MSLALPFTIVGSATLLSRLTGFVRDILIAALLGTSVIADIYVAAFLLPNLVRRMMSEGALNASVVPRLARLEREGGLQAARGYSEDLFSLVVAAAIILVVLAELFMPQVMLVIARGFRGDFEKMADSVLFARIAFPFVGLTLVVALMSALLNSSERFLVAALVPVVLNLLLIGVMLVLLGSNKQDQREIGLLLVITVLAAGFMQCALLWIAVLRAGFGTRPRILDALRGRIDPTTRTLLLLALPGMMIAGSGHLHIVIASQFASLEPRGLALLYYAERLFQLPLGFVASAIGVVLLARVSRAHQQDDGKAVADAQSESLVYAALIILPASIGLFTLSEPIMSVLFLRGAFTPADAAAAAANLRIMALALPAFVLVQVILPSFLSKESFKLPALVVLTAFAANIGSVLILRMQGWTTAPAAGVVFGAWVNALLLIIAMAGGFALRPGTLRRLFAIMASALLMGMAISFLWAQLGPLLAVGQGFAIRASTLGALCVAGILVYLALAAVFGAIDPRALLRQARDGTGE